MAALCLVGLTLASPAAATFPGTNGRIAFSQGAILPVDGDLSAHSQVFTIEPRGGGLTQLTHVGRRQAAAAPDWSPNGQKIVYESNQSGQFAIWVMNADGSGQTQLTAAPGFDDFLPSWSPDGQRIVFSRCSDPFNVGFFAYCDIDVINADGSGQATILSSGHWLNSEAEFSPNGQKIAFSSDRGGLRRAIWVMNADGTSLQQITGARLEGFWPDWDPTGGRILFSDHCCLPHSNLWTVRPDGSDLRRLTHVRAFPLDAAFGSFSPDGTRIALFYTRGCPGQPCKHLYTLHSDGSHFHRVVTGKPDTFLTDWGPG